MSARAVTCNSATGRRMVYWTLVSKLGVLRCVRKLADADRPDRLPAPRNPGRAGLCRLLDRHEDDQVGRGRRSPRGGVEAGRLLVENTAEHRASSLAGPVFQGPRRPLFHLRIPP